MKPINICKHWFHIFYSLNKIKECVILVHILFCFRIYHSEVNENQKGLQLNGINQLKTDIRVPIPGCFSFLVTIIKFGSQSSEEGITLTLRS
jgi:hypothetical protein